MQRWQVIGPEQASSNSTFWLDARTGALLLESIFTAALLCQRGPAGAQGFQISLLADVGGTDATILAQGPGMGSSLWKICVASSVTSGKAQQCNCKSAPLTNGSTWTTLPALDNAQPAGSKGVAAPPISLCAIVTGGAVLATSENIADS